VRVPEVRAREPELAGGRVHPRHEAVDRAATGDVRERCRGVVRARHERADQQVTDRDALTLAQGDRRLTDRSRRARHRHDLVDRE